MRAVTDTFRGREKTHMPGIRRLLERTAPRDEAFSQRAVGAVLMILGLLVALTLASRNDGHRAHGLVAVAGDRLADLLLNGLGVVGLAWIPGFIGLGALLLAGTVRLPRPRRLVGFVSLTFVACGLAQLLMPSLDSVRGSFGPGGLLGTAIGRGLTETLGFAGSLAVLLVTGAALLGLSGNLGGPRSAALVARGLDRMRPLFDRALASLDRRLDRLHRRWPWLDVVRAACRRALARLFRAMPWLLRLRRGAASRPGVAAELDADFSASVPPHPRPDVGLFRVAGARAARRADPAALTRMVEAAFRAAGIEAQVAAVGNGPVVTTMRVDPPAGANLSRLDSVRESLVRALGDRPVSLRLAGPRRESVRIEVPADDRRIVRFGDALRDAEAGATGMVLPIVMGVDTSGRAVVEDLARMPNLLVAGAPGSGKSVFLSALVASLVWARQARELRLVLLSPRAMELAAYERLPHLACPIVTDIAQDGPLALRALKGEMEVRRRHLATIGAPDAATWNRTMASRRRRNDLVPDTMPHVVLVIDDLAPLAAADRARAIGELARIARAGPGLGVHVVAATQRPSDVATRALRAGFPARLAFRSASAAESVSILDHTGAESLLGKGDMLYRDRRGVRRLHAAYLDGVEVGRLVRACAA